jgi:hypothetical protein
MSAQKEEIFRPMPEGESLSAAEVVRSDARAGKIRYNNMVRINNVLKETVIWMKN